MAEARSETATQEKTNGEGEPAEPEAPPFRSSLGHGKGRFLAHAIVHGLEIGRRTPEDFIRHFPPRAIMEGLADRPSLRANILSETIGVNKRVATKKSWESTGEDLEIALQLRETDAKAIVGLFEPDDRVRYLDAKKLWSYVIEGDFWQVKRSDKEGLERAKEHVSFMLERALADELITHRDILEGLTVAKLCEILPRPMLASLIAEALDGSHSGRAFTEVDFLRAVPPKQLVEHVPLPDLWERVVVPKIAQAHGFVDKPEPEPEPEKAAKPDPAAADKAAGSAFSSDAKSGDAKGGGAEAKTEAADEAAEKGASKEDKSDGGKVGAEAKGPKGSAKAGKDEPEPPAMFDDKTTETADPKVETPEDRSATATEVRMPRPPIAAPKASASADVPDAIASMDSAEIDVAIDEVFDEEEDTQRGLKLEQIMGDSGKAESVRRSGGGKSKKKKKS